MSDLEVKLADAPDQANVGAIEVQLAGMSQQAVNQVEHQLEERSTISTADVQLEIDRAKVADEALIESSRLRHEQEEHIASGDLRGAHDLAEARAYELTIADDQGAMVDRTLVQAQHDTTALSWGAHEQAIADDHAASAASYAASGDHEHAAQYAEQAEHHETNASTYADSASHSSSNDSSAVDTTQTEG